MEARLVKILLAKEKAQLVTFIWLTYVILPATKFVRCIGSLDLTTTGYPLDEGYRRVNKH